MNKLIAVEACRCLSVIEDMISTLEQLQLVTPALFGLVDIEQVFGGRLGEILREYSKKRLALEAALAEQQTVRAGGFKSRLKSLEKKIFTCTKEYKIEVQRLTMEFAASREFFERLEQSGVGIQYLLPQQIQVGGGGNRSLASVDAPSAGYSAAQSGPGAANAQSFASIQDLITLLREMHAVQKMQMGTSVQQEQTRKQFISKLTQSERYMQNAHASLLREFDVLEAQNKSEAAALGDQILSINQQLYQNAATADNAASAAVAQASRAEITGAYTFAYEIERMKQNAADYNRRLLDLSKKQKEHSQQVNRDRRRAFLSLRDSIAKFDRDASTLDQEIFRLKHEVRLSDTRIEELEHIIQEYKTDKAERDKAAYNSQKKRERWEMFWELAPECYVAREE